MRVLMIAESFLPRVNGVTGSVLRAARHLRSQGHAVVIVAPSGAPDRTEDGVPIQTVNSVHIPGMAIDVGYPTRARLREIIQQAAPDVIHLASPFVLGYQAAKVAKRLKIPTVAVYQTDISGFARHYGLASMGSLCDVVVRRLHGSVDLTLVPSRASREYLLGLGVANIELWGRGVDADQFNPRRRSPQLRTSWLSPEPDRVVVGYVGRLAPEKRVAALAKLEGNPRIRLVIVGDGPALKELRLALPNAIFTGQLTGSALGQAMASLDILVAPGERETFCQVVQEGMAAGVPVVAPDIGGPRDLIVHGEFGLRYRPGDDAHLAACVGALADNAAARAMMGAAAHLAVRDRTWTRIGDDLVDYYRSVMGMSQPLTSVVA